MFGIQSGGVVIMEFVLFRAILELHLRTYLSANHRGTVISGCATNYTGSATSALAETTYPTATHLPDPSSTSDLCASYVP